MLEIKTILRNFDEVEKFDAEVNNALVAGWKLVRRDVIPGWEGSTVISFRKLYAELEREVKPEPEALDTAEWKLARRNPAAPFMCTACGQYSTNALATCLNCKRVMVNAE